MWNWLVPHMSAIGSRMKMLDIVIDIPLGEVADFLMRLTQTAGPELFYDFVMMLLNACRNMPDIIRLVIGVAG